MLQWRQEVNARNVGPARGQAGEGALRALRAEKPLSGETPTPCPLPSWPHLVARREGGQLPDLGGLVVAAPATQQHLTAHPLLGLCGGTGAGRAAHHVVQVLQVLGGDRLVVVAILEEEGARVNGGAPAQRARASPRLRLGVRTEALKGG